MWVVRDFTLQLVDADSEPITSKDYLEKALQNQKGFSEAIDKKNRIRRLLKSFFKERDCCTMIRPLTKEDQLQNQSMNVSKEKGLLAPKSKSLIFLPFFLSSQFFQFHTTRAPIII